MLSVKSLKYFTEREIFVLNDPRDAFEIMRKPNAMKRMLISRNPPMLIDVFTSSAVPVIDQTKSFELPNALLNDIFQIETTKVHIDGSISMTNNSNNPVTAKVFAETLTVEENGKKKHIINPDKLFIGYINKNLQAKSGTQKITPIKGAKVTSKVI